MWAKPGRMAVLALALLLAGCFRSAGEAIQPTINTGQTLPPPVEDDAQATPEVTAETPGNIRLDEEGDFPPITVIAPTRRAFQSTEEAASGEETQEFITPGIPMPITPATRTPTPSGGALTATPSGLVTPTALIEDAGDGCTYIVTSGDNLFRIAVNNGIPLEELRAANPDLTGSDPILQPGQILNIPGCGQQEAPAEAQPVEAATQPQPPEGGQVYTVRSGDTLYTIAQQFDITVQQLIDANSLPDPDRLSVGQTIIIPAPSGE